MRVFDTGFTLCGQRVFLESAGRNRFIFNRLKAFMEKQSECLGYDASSMQEHNFNNTQYELQPV